MKNLNIVEKNVKNDKNLTRLENYLVNNGIENPEMFLNIKSDEFKNIVTKPENLHNMVKASEIFFESALNGSNILILVDDDADGYTSTALLLRFIEDLYGDVTNVSLLFHEKKSHGLNNKALESILESDAKLVIIPDAASNDFDNQIKILESGKKLIILDHHLIDDEEKVSEIENNFEDYALVNNQLKINKKTNLNFTGAGMVLKFIECVINEYMLNEVFNINDYADLAAVGQIADVSDVSDLEIRRILEFGLEKKNIKSPLLKTILVEEINTDIENIISPKKLSFSIIPKLNAISRIGTLQDKKALIDGLYGKWDEDELVEVEKRRKNKTTGKFNMVNEEHTNYALLDDELGKIKSRQDRIVTKIQKESKHYMDTGNITIIVMPESKVEYRSVTGLIANKIMSENTTPVLFLIEKEDSDILSGSARGCESVIKDFRSWCVNTDLFSLAQGHDNAFGVEITMQNLKEIIKLSQKGFVDSDIIYEVDKLYINESNVDEIRELNEKEYIFGGKLKMPKFGYKGLVINRQSIRQRGSVVTFYHQGLEFIAYKQPLGLIDDLLSDAGFSQYFILDLVGEPSVNSWGGRITQQIVLNDFSINVYNDDIETKKFIDKDGYFSF